MVIFFICLTLFEIFYFCRNLNDRGISEFINLINLNRFVSLIFPKQNKITWLSETFCSFTFMYIMQCLVHNPSSPDLVFSNTFYRVKFFLQGEGLVKTPIFNGIEHYA